CDANRTRAAPLGSRTYGRNYSDRSKLGTAHDRLRKGLLHRSGSDFPNQNVRANQQTIVWIDLAEPHSAPSRDETRRSFGIWKRSRLDHERHAQPTTWKRNRARVRETRLQQSCHDSGGGSGRSGWCDSGRSCFASVSLRNFAAFRILHAISTSETAAKLKKKFCFALGL